MHLHVEIYPNLKSISELFKMYTKSLDSFILASRTMESRAARHSAVSVLTQTVEFLERSLASMLQHDWLLFFSRHNRFAEMHNHLQLSYFSDRLLAAGNYCSTTVWFISETRKYEA